MYGDDYSVWGVSNVAGESCVAETKMAGFRHCFRKLRKHIDPSGKKLLDIGTGKGYLLDVAREFGFDPYGLEISESSAACASKRFPGQVRHGVLQDSSYPENNFDVVTLTDVLEHISEPVPFVLRVTRLLKPGGLVLITTPNFDALSRRMLGGWWYQLKYEHVTYWSRKSLAYLCDRVGISVIESARNTKVMTFGYLGAYLVRYPIPLAGRAVVGIVRALSVVAPGMRVPFPLTGELLVVLKNETGEKVARTA